VLFRSEETYGVTRKGVEALVAQLARTGQESTRVSAAVVNDMIAEIDARLSRQLDEILHHASFQKLESAWRSLKFLVERTDFRENVKIELLNASKDDLLADFEDASDITQSSLYKKVYAAEYGTFGGQPFGAMVGNYEFGAGPQDIKLLQSLAAVANVAHSPFLGAVSPAFFGLDDYQDFPKMKELASALEGPKYAKWRGFRESADARYVGLALPRFLLRVPYGPETAPVKAFNYQEDVSGGHDRYLWGNAAFAFATRLTESFAKYRWCANIIGPMGGGAVENLPVHTFESLGAAQMKIPTEILITERREFELSEEGFMALTMRKGSDNAAFFSANSAQKARVFGQSPEGKEAERNFRLGLQLPYIFIVSRLAHYLKVLQRENIGTWKERTDLESELNNWIKQYVSDMENPLPAVRGRRPLRQAVVTVEDVEGEPGWYRVSLQVRPHFKYMGAYFTLSLVGKLEKK
jgi:type VI secretion system protein ImpC